MAQVVMNLPAMQETWVQSLGREDPLEKEIVTDLLYGLPWWLRGYSVCPQCGRLGFNPWVGKIPWRRKW